LIGSFRVGGFTFMPTNNKLPVEAKGSHRSLTTLRCAGIVTVCYGPLSGRVVRALKPRFPEAPGARYTKPITMTNVVRKQLARIVVFILPLIAIICLVPLWSSHYNLYLRLFDEDHFFATLQVLVYLLSFLAALFIGIRFFHAKNNFLVSSTWSWLSL
jgi:hypothetical protein